LTSSVHNNILKLILKAIEEKKGYDIKVIDVGNRTIVADSFLICSSDSPTQSRAIADNITDCLEEAGHEICNREGYQHGDWVVVDATGIMIHIFLPEIRKHIGLENFWEQEFFEGGSEIFIPERKKGHAGIPSKAKEKAPKRQQAKETKPSVKKPVKEAKTKKAITPGKNILDIPLKGSASRKEIIERELLKKNAPKGGSAARPSAVREASKKEIIEQEILRMKAAKEKASKKPSAKPAVKPAKGKKAVKK